MEACRLGKPSTVLVLLEQTHQTRRQASALSCKLIYLQPPAWPSGLWSAAAGVGDMLGAGPVTGEVVAQGGGHVAVTMPCAWLPGAAVQCGQCSACFACLLSVQEQGLEDPVSALCASQ